MPPPRRPCSGRRVQGNRSRHFSGPRRSRRRMFLANSSRGQVSGPLGGRHHRSPKRHFSDPHRSYNHRFLGPRRNRNRHCSEPRRSRNHRCLDLRSSRNRRFLELRHNRSRRSLGMLRNRSLLCSEASNSSSKRLRCNRCSRCSYRARSWMSLNG